MEQEVRDLVRQEPFVPFRIKLVNGDAHDVPYASTAALLRRGVYLALPDGTWAQFPYRMVASVESLITFE